MKFGCVDAPLDVGARVHPGRGMALKVNHVGVVIFRTPTKKMIETDFIKRCGRSIGRNMTADIRMEAVGFDDHRHRVPANVTLYAPFDLAVARVRLLSFRRYSVNVWGIDRMRNLEPRFPQSGAQFLEQQRGL